MAKRMLVPLRLALLSSPPPSPEAGDSYFDTVIGRPRFFDGSVWKDWV